MKTYHYRSSEWDILEAMTRYGGSFVKQLAVLYRLGDRWNKTQLENAFTTYFQRYDEIAYRTTPRERLPHNKGESA